ncbi:DUF6461 domain-containing protein [Yinghuangia seranimata]|uniref:DUF6461 domain-containing protein n=1 Tax=Yinghuangia seranimata TaxID=408067 RepID=UPI00248AF969|nr:DUF6461 domain-containing protein [Yinghuangia seranimata]MDI2127762.1 DUF6461 domain-containing protein [Yinghuangia seranimata]
MIGDGFRWLAEPTHFPDGFCATFARGLSPEELLDRLACAPEHTAVLDAMDAEDLRGDLSSGEDEDTVITILRAGSRGDWAYALEEVSLYASEPDVLARVSAGTEVAGLFRSAVRGVTWFSLWRDGRRIDDRQVWAPDDLAALETELGIDAPILELLSPTSELLTGFARWL